MEFAQLIADLNEGVSPHVGFEREGLVEYACVGSVGNDVAAEATLMLNIGRVSSARSDSPAAKQSAKG